MANAADNDGSSNFQISGFLSLVGGVTSSPSFGQLISGDLTSRYPAMNLPNNANNGYVLGLPQVSRGYWNANALTGQFFYNGDTVIDDSLTLGFWVSLTSGGAATSQVLYHPVWQYIGGYSVQNSSPSVANGWQTLGAVIAY